jgi:hypothetical protein
LRKLPGILPYAPCPKYLALAIRKNNTHIGPEAFIINHVVIPFAGGGLFDIH